MAHEITIDDLHPTYQHIAKIIGFENAIKMGRECGGEMIYFPKLDSDTGPMRKVRDRNIIEEAKTLPVLALARKYKLTQRQIYTILNKAKDGEASENG